MDFGSLPPEINSGRIYSGPGSAPLLAAAAAWHGLAAEMHSAAASYGSAIAELRTLWHGPSSTAMAAAAAPFIAWLGGTAAAAYDSVFAATVPPPVIAANRALLASLIATNVLGQNTPAIAATEAHYAEMWAQDAAAMYAYAGASAVATRLTPFGAPPQSADANAAADQSAAAASALQSSTASSVESALSQGVSQVPVAAQVNATAVTAAAQLPLSLTDITGILKTFNSVMGTISGPYTPLGVANLAKNWYQIALSIPSVGTGIQGIGPLLHPKALTGVLAPLLRSDLLTGSTALSSAGTVSASAGRAGLVGSLSVPANWASAVPAVRTVAAELPETMLDAAPAMAVNGQQGMFGPTALRRRVDRACARCRGRRRPRDHVHRHRHSAEREIGDTAMVFSDFATLPPEVISTQIHVGPGAVPLLAAAAAWDGLAAELHGTTASYASVISELVVESWQGSSSESMAAAAAPYVAWLSATAGLAEQTAAPAAAAAYEAAVAATVPPAVVAANRSLLATLLQTNILGQNDAAIAATEDEYGQMWAQDVAAMFSYAAASESAGELTPFEQAPATTNDAGPATQAAAAAAAESTSLSSWLKQLEAYITSLTGQYTQFWQNLIGGATGSTEIAPFWETLYSSISQVGTQATWTNVVNATIGLGVSQWKNFFIYAPWSAAMAKSSLGAGLASPGHIASGIAAKPVSAVLGNAPTVGKLSVPAGWATAAPAIRLASTALPATSLAAAAATDFSGLVNEATLGRARVVSTTGIPTRAITGERRQGPVKLDRIIAQLQEMPEQVQHWNVDEAGLDDLVARLRTTPGVHAVHVTDGEQVAVGSPASKLG